MRDSSRWKKGAAFLAVPTVSLSVRWRRRSNGRKEKRGGVAAPVGGVKARVCWMGEGRLKRRGREQVVVTPCACLLLRKEE